MSDQMTCKRSVPLHSGKVCYEALVLKYYLVIFHDSTQRHTNPTQHAERLEYYNRVFKIFRNFGSVGLSRNFIFVVKFVSRFQIGSETFKMVSVCFRLFQIIHMKVFQFGAFFRLASDWFQTVFRLARSISDFVLRFQIASDCFKIKFRLAVSKKLRMAV